MKWLPRLISSRIVLATIAAILSSCQNSIYITPAPPNLNATLNSFAAESAPNFNYSGRYIVYTSDRARKRSIYLYDMVRRRSLPLPGLNQPGSMQSQADLSADGRYIVYRSEQLGKSDIYLYDRLEAKAENLTKNFIGEVRYPTISGNGRFVAFEGNRKGQWDIEAIDRGVGIDRSPPQNSLEPSPAP